jgi:hypothetical protein
MSFTWSVERARAERIVQDGNGKLPAKRYPTAPRS